MDSGQLFLALERSRSTRKSVLHRSMTPLTGGFLHFPRGSKSLNSTENTSNHKKPSMNRGILCNSGLLEGRVYWSSLPWLYLLNSVHVCQKELRLRGLGSLPNISLGSTGVYIGIIPVQVGSLVVSFHTAPTKLL